MKLVVVSGLSGAGKTVALKQFEDLGYYCVDNIPLTLITPLLKRAHRSKDQRYERLALGIDGRESPQEIRRFPAMVQRLRELGVVVQVMFLTCGDDVLLRRYGETRRRHPLSDDHCTLEDAISRERRLLAPISEIADTSLDTSSMNLHELREMLLQRLPESGSGQLCVQLTSFGFKHGAMEACDFMFDVRCLPNPHWEQALRPLTGRDQPVAEWLSGQPEVRAMIDELDGFLGRWLPVFRQQDRAYVTIGIGCTGGQHRSVYIVEQLAERLRLGFSPVIVRHREL